MALAVRGLPVDLDWDDDRVIYTAFAVLAENDEQGARRGDHRQMSG